MSDSLVFGYACTSDTCSFIFLCLGNGLGTKERPCTHRIDQQIAVGFLLCITVAASMFSAHIVSGTVLFPILLRKGGSTHRQQGGEDRKVASNCSANAVARNWKLSEALPLYLAVCCRAPDPPRSVAAP